MFQITVKDAMKIPGLDYFHIVGTDTKGSAKIGDYVTDGDMKYEITAIPLIHRKSYVDIDEVDICIRPGNYDLNALIGKTMYSV